MVQSELGSIPGKAMKIIIACAHLGSEARSASYRVCLLFPFLAAEFNLLKVYIAEHSTLSLISVAYHP
jgi:hypothetical protein